MTGARTEAPTAENMLTTLDLRVVEESAERCVMEMPYSAAAAQPLGLFHAGAILALADSSATHLLRSALAAQDRGSGGLDPARFPLGIQISGNVMRARRDTTLRAESVPLHIGRATAVVETKVHDQAGALVAAVTSTHYLPGGATSR